MELLMDDKGRAVINLPYQMLKRNGKWQEAGEKPYLPVDGDSLLTSQLADPVEPTNPADEDKLFLGLEDEDDSADPNSKKQKLHYGGLNLKKKVETPVDPVDYSNDDCFDTW